MKRLLIALLLMLSLCMVAQTKMTRYLFTYFNNNTTEGQQVCYAVSNDGVNFTPLNDGLPVIASDTISRSGGVRDPHILRGSDGWFYQVLTDMDMSLGKWTCQGIVMLRSRDLVSWQHHVVHFPERYKGTRFANVNAVWAPQTIYDPSAKKLMVYFSLHSDKDGPFPQDAVYYAYANADFSSLESEPQPLFTYPYPTIDTDIVQDQTGLYHLFFNTWGGPDGLQRRQYEFRDLRNQQSWTLVPGHQQPTSLNSEGSTAYQLLDGTWMLSYDCFKDGIYQFCRTSDFRHYELVHETKTEGNFTPRHGSILQITEAEYQHLLKSYGKVFRTGPEYMPAEMEPVTAPFDVSGISRPVFADRTRTVKMNKRGLSTRQIQTAIDRMSRQGGGTVIVPDGQWTSGRIELKSGVCLHLSDGAMLTFSGYIKDYQPAVPTRNEGYDVMSLGAMIYANGAENIGLTGRGHIVGPSTDCEIYQENRKYLVVEECVDVTKPIAERLCDGQMGHPVLLPMTVAPVHCKNVLIEGINIDQGLFWNIVPQYCDNVVIRGVTVNSAGHGRTDGIDIESTTNSLIEYCQLDCGDDCYTIKSGRGEDGVRTARPSVGCVIRHSVALRGGGGLVLGSETAASMWNIYMHDCIFDGTEQGIRIKTRRPRGGGAHDVWVERVMARNIKWNGLTVDMLGSKKWVGELANRFPARQVNELTPEFRNIYIKDFTVDGCQRLIDVKALPERPLTNVLIENFEGHGKDFLRLQDVSGFVMKGGKIHTAAPSAVLDGCQSVMLLDMDFNGKQLKQITNNATLYVTQSCLSSKSFLTKE